MTLLVTGGAGFIGAHFVCGWLEESDEPIVNLDALTYAGNQDHLNNLASDPRHTLVHGDINDGALIKHVLHTHQPRAIIHFAAESHVDRAINAPEAFIQANIVGTFRLLEATRDYWHGLTTAQQAAFRIVHVSTDEVYGPLINFGVFTESHPCKPTNPYSASKAAADHLMHAYFHTYGLPIVITRSANNYGPYQLPEKFIPLCVHKALQHQSIPLYGDGLQVRDWLYVVDHCRAIRVVLDNGMPGEIYNISASNERTNIEVATLVCDMLDELMPLANNLFVTYYKELITHVRDRPGHDTHYALDAHKIQHQLHWRPVHDFVTSLRTTLLWYMHNQDWLRGISGTLRVPSGKNDQ